MNKLKVSTRFVYGIGDFYGGASITVISLLFLFFLTNVVGMKPLFAGIVVFIGRAFDAVMDPILGNLSDRTKSRWGRRNPFFLLGAVPVGFAFGIMWIKTGFTSDGLNLLYYAVAYTLFSVAFSSVMVPYAALAPELTLDYNERTKLISTRMAFSIIGALAASVIPKTIIDHLGGAAKGYLAMALGFGVVFMVIWFIMFAHMKDKEIYSSEVDKEGFLKSFAVCFQNKSFAPLVGIYLFAHIPMDIMSANFIYYLTYFLHRPKVYTVVMGSLLVCAVLSLLVYTQLVKKFGKRVTLMIGASFWAVILALLLFFPGNVPTPVLIVYAVLLGFGTGVSYAIPWSMLPDVIDADEVITGKRREGIYSGVMTFMRKLASSIALLGISYILQISGYISTTDSASVVQPQSAVTAIQLTTSLGPFVFLGLTLLCAWRFPIDSGTYRDIRIYLNARKDRSGESLNAGDRKRIASSLTKATGKQFRETDIDG